MKHPSLITQYRAYLNDNPQGYWFKRKVYGWGWIPAKPHGWLITALFLLLIFSYAAQLSTNDEPTREELTSFFIKLILTILVLIIICYLTGERPRWSWGFENTHKPHQTRAST